MCSKTRPAMVGRPSRATRRPGGSRPRSWRPTRPLRPRRSRCARTVPPWSSSPAAAKPRPTRRSRRMAATAASSSTRRTTGTRSSCRCGAKMAAAPLRPRPSPKRSRSTRHRRHLATTLGSPLAPPSPSSNDPCCAGYEDAGVRTLGGLWLRAAGQYHHPDRCGLERAWLPARL